MTGPSSNPAGRLRRAALPLGLLLCAAALLLGFSLGRPAVNREQELRVALTARDMAQGGSWLVPHYRGQLRLQKPPLMYWFVATAYRIAGATNSPRVARLPTAAFGLGLVALIYAGGRRLVGRRRATAAAFVAASSFLFLRHSMLGETDIPLAFFTALAIFLGWEAMRRDHAPAWWLGAGGAAGLGFMIKGPAALAIPLLTLLAAVFLDADARRGPKRRALWAVPVFVALAVPWYAWLLFSDAISAAAGSAVHKEMGALFGETGHPGPLPFYLYSVPLAMLPWGLLLIPAVPLLARHARRRRGARILAIWLAAALVSLTLVKSKQIHYATLLLVPCALAAGCFAIAGLGRLRSWRTRFVRGYASGLAGLAAATGLALALAPLLRADLPAGACIACGILLAAAGAAGLALRHARAETVLATMFAVAAAGQIAYLGPLLRAADPHAAIPGFAADVRARAGADGGVVHLGDDGGALEFYLGRPPAGAPSFEAAWAATGPGSVIAVMANRKNPVFPEHPPIRPFAEIRAGDLHFGAFAR